MVCLLFYLYSDISPFIMCSLSHLLVHKVVYKHVSKYDQSLSGVETYIPTKLYGFHFELWVLNLKEEKKEEEKKMKNSAHHSPIHL